VERRAKERLIGAGILVGLLVLVVPELLSGPKPASPKPADLLPSPSDATAEPVRNVTVDLATSRAPAASEPQSEPAGSVASAPPSAPSAPPPPSRAAEQATTVAEPVAPAPKALETAAAPPTSLRDWVVQAGSFANRGNAEALGHEVKSLGFPVYISALGSGSAERFRVRIGPYVDRPGAERAAARLKASGHPSTLVRPGAK
jgi:DedD protein